MRPEVDRLIIGLNNVTRAGMADDASAVIATLSVSLRSNLVELEDLVGQRLKSRDRLSRLLRSVFQANQGGKGYLHHGFKSWKCKSIVHLKGRARKIANAILPHQSVWIVRHKPHSGALPPSWSSWFKPRRQGQKQQLSVVEFQLRRSLDDLESEAKDTQTSKKKRVRRTAARALNWVRRDTRRAEP